MKTYFPIFAFACVLCWGCSSEVLTSEKILNNSIAYHDPEGKWGALQVQLNFEESRPDGSIRKSKVWLDQPGRFFKLNRGEDQIHGVAIDSCFIEKGDIDCDRVVMLKNYYTYLWGLPMKLKDSGTKVSDDFNKVVWEGTEVYILSVDYEKDDWKFFFDKNNFRLIGYEFVQNNGSSEKIILDGEVNFGKWRIPAGRSWYKTSENDLFLGKDVLVGVSSYDF
ncbi:MAG: DUF6503 family protein [Cyclobacteriaceae bacterium]|nr:DUF6503 family protein [Cyclobacteriaceae bacterium]